MHSDIERISDICSGCICGGSEPSEIKSDFIQRSIWKLFDELFLDLITKLLPLTKRGYSVLLLY
jgi:hypothetical protein